MDHPAAILFVCTANCLRSPMAAALCRARLLPPGAAGSPAWRVESAGTWAEDGQPALPAAVRVLRELGLDLSRHRARRVSAALLSAFDLVLTMEQGHQEALRAEFPGLAARVYRLSEMVGGAWDVLDPEDLSLGETRALARTLDQLLAAGLDRIMMLATQSRTAQPQE